MRTSFWRDGKRGCERRVGLTEASGERGRVREYGTGERSCWMLQSKEGVRKGGG